MCINVISTDYNIYIYYSIIKLLFHSQCGKRKSNLSDQPCTQQAVMHCVICLLYSVVSFTRYWHFKTSQHGVCSISVRSLPWDPSTLSMEGDKAKFVDTDIHAFFWRQSEKDVKEEFLIWHSSGSWKARQGRAKTVTI